MGNSVFSYNLIYQKGNRKDADVGIYISILKVFRYDVSFVCIKNYSTQMSKRA